MYETIAPSILHFAPKNEETDPCRERVILYEEKSQLSITYIKSEIFNFAYSFNFTYPV
jgi:hypothetical protein